VVLKETRKLKSSKGRYTGLVHVHSRYSHDGKLSTEELKRMAVADGHSFILISDHCEDLDLRRCGELIGECEKQSDAGFVMVAGIEFHNQGIAVFGLERAAPGQEDPTRALEESLTGRTFNVLVHPRGRKSEIVDAMMRRMHAVEIWNVKADGGRFPSARRIRLWRGWREKYGLKAIFGTDFHGMKERTGVHVEVELDVLSREGLMEALRAGEYRMYNREKEWDPENMSPKEMWAVKGYGLFRGVAIGAYRRAKVLMPAGLRRRGKKMVDGEGP